MFDTASSSLQVGCAEARRAAVTGIAMAIAQGFCERPNKLRPNGLVQSYERPQAAENVATHAPIWRLMHVGGESERVFGCGSIVARGGGSHPALRTVLNMWTTCTRLRFGEMSGCFYGCGGAYERGALAHDLVCANVRGVLRCLGDRECTKQCLVFVSLASVWMCS